LARIAGVDLPKNKRVEIGLTYIYGIGKSTSMQILSKLNIDPNTTTDQLSESEINSIRQVIDNDYRVEGELRTEVSIEHQKIKWTLDLTEDFAIENRFLFEDKEPAQMPAHEKGRGDRPLRKKAVSEKNNLNITNSCQ